VSVAVKEHTYAKFGVSSTSYHDTAAELLSKNPPRCACVRPLVDPREELPHCHVCGKTVGGLAPRI
jgi:hypothetical protein